MDAYKCREDAHPKKKTRPHLLARLIAILFTNNCTNLFLYYTKTCTKVLIYTRTNFNYTAGVRQNSHIPHSMNVHPSPPSHHCLAPASSLF